jgi:hypothetical protein
VASTEAETDEAERRSSTDRRGLGKGVVPLTGRDEVEKVTRSAG